MSDLKTYPILVQLSYDSGRSSLLSMCTILLSTLEPTINHFARLNGITTSNPTITNIYREMCKPFYM